MSKQNRKSFRMSDTVHLLYDVIDDAIFEQGVERWKLQLGSGAGLRSTLLDIDARIQEKIMILQAESTTNVAEALLLLNAKINAVMDGLPEMRESKVALANQEPQACEIGADGMLFAADKEYAPGTKMALRFLLATDSRYIETFCDVVRITKPPENSNANLPYGIAVRFCGMPAAQKEIIIQHLFDRESETLRMRRLDIEAHT